MHTFFSVFLDFEVVLEGFFGFFSTQIVYEKRKHAHSIIDVSEVTHRYLMTVLVNPGLDSGQQCFVD